MVHTKTFNFIKKEAATRLENKPISFTAQDLTHRHTSHTLAVQWGGGELHSSPQGHRDVRIHADRQQPLSMSSCNAENPHSLFVYFQII